MRQDLFSRGSWHQGRFTRWVSWCGWSLSQGWVPPHPPPGLGPAAFIPACIMGSQGQGLGRKETPGQLVPGPETAPAMD